MPKRKEIDNYNESKRKKKTNYRTDGSIDHWSTNEVINWLIDNNLGKFRDIFSSKLVFSLILCRTSTSVRVLYAVKQMLQNNLSS